MHPKHARGATAVSWDRMNTACGTSGTARSHGRHWLAGHPHRLPQASPRSCFQIPREPVGLVTGLRSGKEKINSLCPTHCCPFPTSCNNSVFVPGKANDRGTDAVRITFKPQKEVPEPWGGCQAASSVVMEANQQDRLPPPPPRLAWSRLPGTLRLGTCPRAVGRWSSPKDSAASGFRSGLEPNHAARCPQVGKVGK